MINDEERKEQAQQLIHAEHLDGLERNDFCDIENSRKYACHKGKIEFNKQNKEGGQPK